MIKRVLIFDWDIHHGQGTQEVFWKDSRVLFVSMNLGAEFFDVHFCSFCIISLTYPHPTGYELPPPCSIRFCEPTSIASEAFVFQGLLPQPPALHRKLVPNVALAIR